MLIGYIYISIFFGRARARERQRIFCVRSWKPFSTLSSNTSLFIYFIFLSSTRTIQILLSICRKYIDLYYRQIYQFFFIINIVEFSWPSSDFRRVEKIYRRLTVTWYFFSVSNVILRYPRTTYSFRFCCITTKKKITYRPLSPTSPSVSNSSASARITEKHNIIYSRYFIFLIS